MFEDLNPTPPDSSPESVPSRPTSGPGETAPEPIEPDSPSPIPSPPLESAGEPIGPNHAGLRDWKRALCQDFEQWLESVDELPLDDEDEEAPSETPDLYSFYEQLAMVTAEYRKANRRTAEVLSQWGDTLARFDGDLRLLRESLASAAQAKADTLSRSYCLTLVELLDRMQRLAMAFNSPPKPSWWEDDGRMRKAWETQRQAFDILLGHLDALLKQAGVTRIDVLGQPFDPTVMIALAVEPDAQRPHHTVIEEMAAGYRHRGELLRVAQVKVTLNPSSP